MSNTLKSWLYEHRNTLYLTFLPIVFTAIIELLFHPIHNAIDRFYPPSITPAAASTSTPSPTDPSPILTTPSPSVSPTTQTPTNSPFPTDTHSPTNTPTPMPKTSRSPEWNPTLDQAVATEKCGHPAWNADAWITLAKSDNVSAIAQKTYTNGFKCDMEHTLDDGFVEFLVPKDAKTFTITAGQSDYSRDTNITVTFEISDPISDKVLDSASLRLNEAKEFSIDVSSVPRLKMKALVEAAPGESRKSDISVIAIWADPKFS